jgi:hypothetical protein
VLDPPDGDLRDVEHLPPHDPGRRAVGGQLPTAPGAGAGLVDHDLIGPLDLPQRAALGPGWPPGLRPDRPHSDFGAGFPGPPVDGGLEEFREEAASCRVNSAICPSCSAIHACNATTRAASAS